MQDNKKDNIEEYLPEVLGERIAFLRRRAGFTQSQLAQQLGISAQAVSKWESGLSCPDIMMLVPLSRIFGVSTDVLLCGSRPFDDILEPGLETQQAMDEQIFEDEFQSLQVYNPTGSIHSLHVDLGSVETVIRTGEKFALEVSGYRIGDCVSRVKDGIWYISDQGYKAIILGIRNFFKERKAVITIPMGTHFRDLKLSTGTGTITGSALLTDTSTLNIGAGTISLTGFCSGTSQIKCGMGEIKVEGSLLGMCKMNCGMGKIQAKINPPEDYGYYVNVGMGEVKIGDNSFSGISGRHRVNPNAENFFDISCGMGVVEVKFA